MKDSRIIPEQRPIPNNLDAERAVLAAILANNKVLAFVLPILDSSDFFLEQHRGLYEHLQGLIGSGRPADLITLTDYLHTQNVLDSVGGAPYIASLGDGLMKSTNVEFHAAIVKEKAARRHILYAAYALQKQSYEGDDLGIILDRTETSFRELRTRLPGNSTNFFDTWEEFETAPALFFAIEGFLQNDAITGIAGLSGHMKTWVATSIGSALLFGPGKFGICSRCRTAQSG